jgi:WD40 repeat protein
VWELEGGLEVAEAAEGQGAPLPDGDEGDGRDNDAPVVGRELWVLSGHTDCVRGCSVDTDGGGSLGLSVSIDQTCRVWDLETGLERHLLHCQGSLLSGCALAQGL